MNSLAYTFTIGPGELSKQGLYLLNSILKNTEAGKEDIFVYIVDEEKEDIEECVIEEVKEKATLIEGPLPKEHYPHSAAVGALRKTAKISNKDYLALLDTDTLVLDDIEVHAKKKGELYLTTEPLSRKYWASKEKSDKALRKLFNKFGFEYPENRTVQSSFGEEEINPYYNAGLILTKNNDFPERFLKLTQKVHGELPGPNHFADQISISLLSTEYNLIELEHHYNSFQTLYPYPQEGTKVVHYVETDVLYRCIYLSKKIGSGWFASKVQGTGLLDDYNSTNKIKKGLIILNESYFSYNVRIKGRETINFKIRKKLIFLLELTNTKQLAREIVNTILREEKFKEEKFK